MSSISGRSRHAAASPPPLGQGAPLADLRSGSVLASNARLMRILLVLKEPLETDPLGHRCRALVREGHDLAICYVLGPDATLRMVLGAQRRITALLREALRDEAEMIPVFAVTEKDGDTVEECARAWGAAEVKT
jgi:hypothetical protein